MSKLSEDLESTIKRREESGEAFKLAQMTASNTLLDRYPGFDHFAKWARWKLNAIIRKGKAYYGGADPWPDAETAVLETAEKLEKNIYMLLIESIAAGLAVGMNRSEKNWTGMFKANGEDSDFWGRQVHDHSIEVSNDWDTMVVIRRQVTDSLGSWGVRAGMAKWVGKETLRVWDAWDHTLAATSTKLFLTGMEMGERWRDEEILEGILKATDRFPE